MILFYLLLLLILSGFVINYLYGEWEDLHNNVVLVIVLFMVFSWLVQVKSMEIKHDLSLCEANANQHIDK